jgi:hypothetical protein
MNFLVPSIFLFLLEVSETPASGMNLSYSAIGIIITILIAIISAVFYGGKQHQRLNNIEDDTSKNIKPAIQKIETKIDTNIIPTLTTISAGVSYLQGTMDKLNINRVTKSKSPLVLNDHGLKILTDSGIDKIIDDNYETILSKVKNSNPINAYQAQETIKDVVKDLINNPKLKNVIEIGAFSCGSDVSTVLFVGAINIRDKILTELNLYPKDIDEHDPLKK